MSHGEGLIPPRRREPTGLESTDVSDLPPADWYTDPEDESQYRYWDGSAWTEHRAPRHTDHAEDPDAAPDGMRGPGQLIANTFSLTRRRWRGCAAVALICIVSQAAAVVLVIVSASDILMGELGAVWNRVSEPGVDLTEPEHEAYFRSLEFDLAPINFVPALLGLLAFWVSSNVMQAAVTRIALSDLRDRALTTSDALRQALRRVPRLVGVQLQILAIFVIAGVLALVVQGVLVQLVGDIGWLLLILLIPAFIVGTVYALVVTPLAYVVASAGPRTWSLRYGVRLVRGRLWATLGRLLVVFVVLFAVSLAVGLVFTVAGDSAGPPFDLVSELVQAVVGTGLAVVGLIAAAILYHDLAGESD